MFIIVHHETTQQSLCVSLGYFGYFSSMGMFSWTTIMSFDLGWTFTRYFPTLLRFPKWAHLKLLWWWVWGGIWRLPSSCLFWKYTCPSPTTNHQSNTINHQTSQQPTTNQVREPASHNGQFKVLGVLLCRLGFACCLYRHSINPSIPSSQVWAIHALVMVIEVAIDMVTDLSTDRLIIFNLSAK